MKPQPLYRQPFHTLTVAESGAENRTPKHCREPCIRKFNKNPEKYLVNLSKK